MTQPIPQSVYLVSNGTGTIYPTVVFNRAPTVNDLNGPSGQKFEPTQRWVDTSNNNEEWFLLNFNTSAGYYQANWVLLSSGSGGTETLTGNSGGAVPPTSNNINVVGDGTTVNVVGNPATSTLTISTVGTGVTETLTADDATIATPSGGTITVSGGTTGLTTTASSHTLDLTGTLVVAHGGTGQSSFTDHSALVATGTTNTGAFQDVASVASGQVLISQGTSTLPAWSATPTVTSITFGSGNALNTYVQGTFVPDLAFGGSSTGITYNARSGEYTQIGNIVYFTLNINLSSKGAQTGSATIAGLPVTAGGTVADFPIPHFANLTFNAGFTMPEFQVGVGGTSGNLYQFGSGQGDATNLLDSNFANNTVLGLSGFYFTS